MRAVFEWFTDEARLASSPLYERLSQAVAADEDLLRLAAEGHTTAQRPNLLFAAVHELLLAGERPPLAAWYASVSRDARAVDDAELPAAFKDFALAHYERIADRIGTRMVQTNEVARCSVIVPCLVWIERHAAHGRPLAIVDLGSSAGLNLLFDRWAYRWSNGAMLGDEASAPLTLECEVRGEADPPVDAVDVAWRRGHDLYPIDPRDPEQVLWMRALVWPEHRARDERLSTALAVAAEDPPPVVRADALASIGDIVREVPDEHLPVVTHSMFLGHVGKENRKRFIEKTMPAVANERRDLAWLSMDGRHAYCVTWHDGERTDTVLADWHPHGEWIEWSDA